MRNGRLSDRESLSTNGDLDKRAVLHGHQVTPRRPLIESFYVGLNRAYGPAACDDKDTPIVAVLARDLYDGADHALGHRGV